MNETKSKTADVLSQYFNMEAKKPVSRDLKERNVMIFLKNIKKKKKKQHILDFH